MPLNKTACTYALMHEYGANLTAAAVFWLGIHRLHGESDEQLRKRCQKALMEFSDAKR